MSSSGGLGRIGNYKTDVSKKLLAMSKSLKTEGPIKINPNHQKKSFRINVKKSKGDQP